MKRQRVSLTPGLVPVFVLTAMLTHGLACASTPAWELPPPPPRDAPVVQPGTLHRSELANGMRLLILEDHRLPRFSLGVTTRRGAALETLDEAGLASFTAELMERGAGDRDALELAAVVDRLGASLSVGVGWDSMSASVGGLSRDLDALFPVLVDVVRRPRFDRDEAERVRAQELAGLERAKDDPSYLASKNLMDLLYAGHRFGLPVEGTRDSVSRLDAAAARAFYERVFVPGNAIFFATGDVDPADLQRRAEAAFGAWPEGPVPPTSAPPPSPAPPSRVIRIVDRPDLGQAQIRMGHDGMARTDPGRVEASLMNRVLGSSGFSSRLMARVRAEEGLTYSIGSYFAMRRQPGPFIVSTFTRAPEVGTVVGILIEELERIRTSPPDTGELARAQSMSTGRFGLGLETSSSVARSLVDLDVQGLPVDALDTYRGRVRAATLEGVAAAARSRIDPDRVGIVVVGPAEVLRPQLEAFGTVEVVSP